MTKGPDSAQGERSLPTNLAEGVSRSSRGRHRRHWGAPQPPAERVAPPQSQYSILGRIVRLQPFGSDVSWRFRHPYRYVLLIVGPSVFILFVVAGTQIKGTACPWVGALAATLVLWLAWRAAGRLDDYLMRPGGQHPDRSESGTEPHRAARSSQRRRRGRWS